MGTHPIFESDFDCLTEMSDFANAAEEVKSLTSLTNEQKLEVYGLYKQATVGDCNTDKPGMLDVKGKAKWEAWNGKKGLDKQAAEAAYVALCGELKAKYN